MKLVKTECLQSNFHRFTFNCDYNDKQEFFISSDWHFDNPKCNRKLLFKHLDEALERNAWIVVTGDLLCLMQGKYDKRSNKSDILPEHNKFNYLDAVIEDTADKLGKYANNILLISRGNHETSVSQRNETDVMLRLVERMNTLYGSNIQIGNYTGYYTIACHYAKGKSKHSTNIGYTHGIWGGIITKGTLSVVRMAAIMPDADAIFSGHTHDGWIMSQPRLRLNESAGKVETKDQWHIKTGTYKEEFDQGRGWAVQKIGMPKYLGGCWMTLEFKKEDHNKLLFQLTNG